MVSLIGIDSLALWKYHAQLVRPGPIAFRTSKKFIFTCPGTSTRGDQKVRGKVLLNRIAFIDCNENS